MEFLTRGPKEIPVFSLLGIRFVSLSGSVELIGDIVEIIDSIPIPILVVKDPIAIGRDTKNVNKFNFIKISKANPIVQDVIYIPITSVAFTCIPSDQFLNNYLAARSGLVSPPAALIFDGESVSIKL